MIDGDKRCGCGAGHRTFGECIRSKGLRVEGCRDAVGGADRTRQKKWDAELDAYRDARAQGIQPSGTSLAATERAIRMSDAAGKAFDAGTGTFGDGV